MKNITLCVKTTIFCTLLFVASVVHAAGTVDIPDTYDSDVTNAFDIADGTTLSTNGVLIVFEGELSFDTNVTAVVDGSDRMLASTQLYVQMKLFDDLPSVDSFTNAQAAVLGLFDTGDLTNGTLYAISGSGASAGWLQLTNSAAPIAVAEGNTNLVTIILRYPEGSFTTYEYTASLSDPDNTTQVTSQNLISPLNTESGIATIGVVGEGALVSSANAAGDPAPLSSRIDFSVYQTTNGLFLVDLYTVDENGNGTLDVYAKIDGVWVLIGTVDAEGEGSNHYQLTVTGLTVGESYLFKVIDEEDRTHLSNGEIEVKSIKMDAVQLTIDNFFIIEFNSEDFKSYQLIVSADLNTPIADWDVEDVQVNGDQGWSVEMDTFQGTAGGRTQIRVPRDETNAFFKVILVD